jgi:hypothetical protein
MKKVIRIIIFLPKLLIALFIDESNDPNPPVIWWLVRYYQRYTLRFGERYFSPIKMRWTQLGLNGQKSWLCICRWWSCKYRSFSGTDLILDIEESLSCLRGAFTSKAINIYKSEFESETEELTPAAGAASCVLGAAAAKLNSTDHDRAGDSLDGGNLLYDLFGNI